MNPVRSRFPIIGIVLTGVLIAGITVAPSRAEAQVRKPNVRPVVLKKTARATDGEAAPKKEYPRCSQSHAGRTYRTKRLLRDGDSKVLKSIAGHTVIYAKERYGIQDITTNADYNRAVGEMYDFLSWKLGNPSLAAAQWISAGYQHFDHHSDEAAAALLGMELPGPGAQVRLPKELSDWLKAQVDSLMQEGEDGESMCASMVGDSTYVGFACEVLLPFVKEAIEQSIDRIGISSAALMGKNKYDVTDDEIEFLIHVKRNPVPYTSGGRWPVKIRRPFR